jgi:hypothetical protein
LKQIQSINYEINGLQETLLGYGTILVQTYIGDLVIHDVEKPSHIYKKMLTTLNDRGIEPAGLEEDAQPSQNQEDE